MRLPALALLLAAAPALAQPAPPSAADSVLVERVIDALQVEAVTDDLLGPTWRSGFERAGVDPVPVVEDSLHTVLLTNLRPALLREAEAYLTAPSYALFVSHIVEQSARLEERGGMDRLSERAAHSDPDSLADLELSRRLVLARREVDVLPTLMRRAVLQAAEAAPENAAMLEAEGGVDARVQEFQAWTGNLTPTAIALTRASMYGLPEEVLTEAVQFYESPAGRYVQDASIEAALRVVVPPMADMMASTFADQPPPPLLYAPPDDAATLIEEVAAIQNRLPYPDAVRADGVEGVVVVRLVVGGGGAVAEAEVVSSPDPRLSAVVLDAVRATRFTPVVSGGQPARTPVTFPFEFSLGGRGGADGGR